MRRGWFTMSLGFLAFAVVNPAWAQRDVPPPPIRPAWPHRVVTRQILPAAAYQAAQLDGRGRQELLCFRDPYNSEGGRIQPLIIYRWRGGRFVEYARTRLPAYRNAPVTTVGDLNGDGRDEICTLGDRNELFIIHLQRGRLRVTKTRLPDPWLVCSLAISGVRRRGRPELLATVDPRYRWDEAAEPDGHFVVAYGRRTTGWTRRWRQAFAVRASRLELLTGPYGPGLREGLVLRHHPSGIDSIAYDGVAWDGRRLVRRFLEEAGPYPPLGMRMWIAASPGLLLGRTVIASSTEYLYGRDANHKASRQGELLLWQGGRVRTAYHLPGEPLAVGEFRQPGRLGILVLRPKGVCLLIEPRRARPRQG
ncbi:MAG TPA: VCBS repeat-containing protein [Armatimonadota bacterium]|nr:VCBS repeat-containing protein [Armatimonadota bacterium]